MASVSRSVQMNPIISFELGDMFTEIDEHLLNLTPVKFDYLKMTKICLS